MSSFFIFFPLLSHFQNMRRKPIEYTRIRSRRICTEPTSTRFVGRLNQIPSFYTSLYFNDFVWGRHMVSHFMIAQSKSLQCLYRHKCGAYEIQYIYNLHAYWSKTNPKPEFIARCSRNSNLEWMARQKLSISIGRLRISEDTSNSCWNDILVDDLNTNSTLDNHAYTFEVWY